MSILSRGRFGPLVTACLMVGAIAGLGGGRSAAGELAADPSVLSILRGGDYAAVGDANYLLWATSGKALDKAIRNLQGSPKGGTYREAAQYAIAGKAAGTQVPDGECVALVRGGTKGGANLSTKNWRRGRNVVNHGGKPVAQGTAIARFAWSAAQNKYVYVDDHVAFFAGYRSPSEGGGISIWDQNWAHRCIKWHSLKKGGTGFSNPEEYFVVEVD